MQNDRRQCSATSPEAKLVLAGLLSFCLATLIFPVKMAYAGVAMRLEYEVQFVGETMPPADTNTSRGADIIWAKRLALLHQILGSDAVGQRLTHVSLSRPIARVLLTTEEADVARGSPHVLLIRRVSLEDPTTSRARVPLLPDNLYESRARDLLARAESLLVNERVPVIVHIATSRWATKLGQSEESRALVEQVQSASNVLVREMPETSFRLKRIIRGGEAIAVDLDKDLLPAVLAHPLVTDVELDQSGTLVIPQQVPVVQSRQLTSQNTLYRGGSVAIAILDSGVASEAPSSMYRNRILKEACFSDSGDGRTSACRNGALQDFGTYAGDPSHNSAYSSYFHGNAVMESIGGTASTSYEGVAPDVKIISINITHRVHGSQCGALPSCLGVSTSAYLDALGWVEEQLDAGGFKDANGVTYPLVGINMSFGFEKYSGTCGKRAVIDRLHAKNVVLVAASGNDDAASKVMDPSCRRRVVSVGGTWDQTRLLTTNHGQQANVNVDTLWVWPFASGVGTNRSARMNMFAPAGMISVHQTADSSINPVEVQGTSFAAPAVVGAVAVLRSVYPTASVSALEAALQSTGPTIMFINGVAKKRLDVNQAAAFLGTGPSTPFTPTLTKEEDYLCQGLVDLDWTPPPLGIITHYILQSSLNQSFTNLWEEISTVEDETTTSTPYTAWYRVKACNGGVCGLPSNAVKVTYYAECL